MIRLNLVEGFEQNRNKKRTAQRLVLFVFSLLTLAWPIWPMAQAEVVAAPGAPTLIAPATGSAIIETKPLITGLSANDTWVKIFIDGVFNGQFKVDNHLSGTANFAYEPFLHLKPGHHTVTARAMDMAGRQSGYSQPLNFLVEYPYPAPTLVGATVNERTTAQRPWLVGVALNDSLIKVFIDGQYNGQLMVTNDESGVGHFAYRTFYPITAGQHTAYAIAIDADGKESAASMWVEFTIAAPLADAGVVKGEETSVDPDTDSTDSSDDADTNTNGDTTTGGQSTEGDDATDENTNTNEAATTSDDSNDEDSNSRWPLIVGLTVLAVVIIVMIDNMVRRTRKGDSNGSSTPKTPSSPVSASTGSPATPFSGTPPSQNPSARSAKDFFPPTPKH